MDFGSCQRKSGLEGSIRVSITLPTTIAETVSEFLGKPAKPIELRAWRRRQVSPKRRWSPGGEIRGSQHSTSPEAAFLHRGRNGPKMRHQRRYRVTTVHTNNAQNRHSKKLSSGGGGSDGGTSATIG